MSTFDPTTAPDRPVVGSMIEHEDLPSPLDLQYRIDHVAHYRECEIDDPGTLGFGVVLIPQAEGHGLWAVSTHAEMRKPSPRDVVSRLGLLIDVSRNLPDSHCIWRAEAEHALFGTSAGQVTLGDIKAVLRALLS